MKLSRQTCAGLLVLSALLLLAGGCARSGAGDGVSTAPEPRPVDRTPLEGVEEADRTLPETPPAVETYDLEEEMPVEDTLSVAPEEDIVPERVDTALVRVEEATPEPAPAERFGLGYRVQIFASSELDPAKSLKEKIMAESGLTTYIEYEDGLYKVRVGDYASRDAAAAARSALSERFPDCWIVSTTIRK